MGKGSASQAPTQSSVVQTSLPAYAQPYFTNLMQQGLQAYSQPYQAYQGQMVAGMSPSQLAAQSQLGGMQAVPGAMNEAGQIGTNVANSAANFNPNINAQTVNPNQVNYQGYQAAQLGGVPQVNAGQVGAMATGVQNWTDPGVAAQYMSPYTQNVMSAQEALMSQQNKQQLNNINSQATQSGAFGGDRQAIADAAQNQIYQQNLAQMQAGALQNAYGQGQNTFLQSQGQGLQSQMANQAAALQAAQSNQGTNLQGQMANQQAGLTGGLANLQAMNTAGQYNAGQNLAGQLANQQTGLQGQIANQGTNLQAQNLNNQYLMQALGQQASAGQNLGYLGNMQQNAGLNYIQALNQMGGQQQQQQQNLLNNAYTQWVQQLTYPQTMAQGYSGILHGVPVQPQGTYTNYQAAPSMTNQIGGLAGLFGQQAAGGVGGV